MYVSKCFGLKKQEVYMKVNFNRVYQKVHFWIRQRSTETLMWNQFRWKIRIYLDRRNEIALHLYHVKVKEKLSTPVTDLDWARGFQEFKVPRFHENGTGWWWGCQPYAPATFTPRKYTWYSFLLEAGWPQGHSATGRIMSLKNSNDTIRNRTRNLPVCSVVS
jgi:hypothetical protein